MTPGKEKIAVGDEVLIEQAWEDEAGHYHDECLTVSRILPDGQLRFRIGHWKTRTQREQKLQAWINQGEWYASDVYKL
jgi:putative aminopeptidase FrvX